MTRGTGFIDFSDLDQDPDAWRSDIEKGGKVYVAQGKRCHESHPDLNIGGGTLIGGNCRDHQRHKNVSLYVALDYGQSHPHFEPGQTPPHCVYYPIQNMKVPTNPVKFDRLIDMMLDYLAAGHRVHVGCIGGHGRTGLVIGAIVARLGIAPDNDAIKWVRDNYCPRAIETAGQENFLVVHFGAKMPPAKSQGKVDKRGR